MKNEFVIGEQVKAFDIHPDYDYMGVGILEQYYGVLEGSNIHYGWVKGKDFDYVYSIEKL